MTGRGGSDIQGDAHRPFWFSVDPKVVQMRIPTTTAHRQGNQEEFAMIFVMLTFLVVAVLLGMIGAIHHRSRNVQMHVFKLRLAEEALPKALLMAVAAVSLVALDVIPMSIWWWG